MMKQNWIIKNQKTSYGTELEGRRNTDCLKFRRVPTLDLME